ncbi:50S ribosomal protein L4 [Candidatus Vidania fulgoroideorum]
MIYKLKFFFLLEEVFVKKSSFFQVINCINSNLRKVVSAQKSKGFVSYSNRKISNQKGTGSARHGLRSSPTFVGGARAFPNRINRNFRRKINSKLYSSFIRSVFYDFFVKDNIYLVSDDFFPSKTKLVSSLLSLLTKKGSVLVIKTKKDSNIFRYSKNISNVSFTNACFLNPDLIVRSSVLILSKNSLGELSDLLNAKDITK